MPRDLEVIFEGIRDITGLLEEGDRNAILLMAVTGAGNATKFAPADTGALRASISYSLPGGAGNLDVEAKKDEAYVGTPLEYAPYVEFGTRYQAPQPYLRPSLALLKGETPEIVKEKMDAEFKLGPLKHGEDRVKF
jgi:HK97 gp10 family phage protein